MQPPKETGVMKETVVVRSDYRDWSSNRRIKGLGADVHLGYAECPKQTLCDSCLI